MKIRGSGNNIEDMVPYRFEMEGKTVGIATSIDHVVIEVQDVTHTIYIHASRQELEKVLNFCRKHAKEGTLCGCGI